MKNEYGVSASAFVIEGELEGHPVRRARKTFQCDGWTDRRGHARIVVGDYYVEGFGDGSAGGFGCARICLSCVGPITVNNDRVQRAIDIQAKALDHRCPNSMSSVTPPPSSAPATTR